MPLRLLLVEDDDSVRRSLSDILTGDGFDVPLPFAGAIPPDRTQLDAMAALIIAERRDPARPTDGNA